MKPIGVHIEFDIERKLVILVGQLDENNKLNGVGRKMKISGELEGVDIWEGQFKESLPHGFNKHMCAYWNGDHHNLFIGNWKDGLMHGYVKGAYANGQTMEGLYERNFYRESKDDVDSYDPNNAAIVSKIDFDRYTIYHPLAME